MEKTPLPRGRVHAWPILNRPGLHSGRSIFVGPGRCFLGRPSLLWAAKKVIRSGRPGPCSPSLFQARRSKIPKSVGKGQNFKKFRQSTHLTERFKMSTISWGFVGIPHGRVGKVTDLHFKGVGSNPGSNLKLSNFHENFCISLFYSLKYFAIICWLLDTCWSCIVLILMQDLALLYSSSKCVLTQKNDCKVF
jgi:hypothetical protein